MIREVVLVLFLCTMKSAAETHNKVNDWKASPPVPGSATSDECLGDVFPDKLDTTFASFNIEYRNTYKVLTNAKENKKYVLWQRGCTKPTAETGVTEYFEVPLTSIWSQSSTMNGILEFIGERRSLRAVQGFYTSSPCIHQQNFEGYTLDAAYSIGWDADNQHWCKADWTGACSGISEEFEALGIDGVLNSDYNGNPLSDNIPAEIRMSDTREDTFLKIAEWNEYVAAFFNREKEIQDFASEMRARWVCNSEAANAVAAEDRKKVLYLSHLWSQTAGQYESGYKAATCTSDVAQYRYCELLKAANTIPINEDVSELLARGHEIDANTGEVLGLTAADVVEWAADADVVIFSQTWCPNFDGNETTCATEYDKMIAELSGIKAVANAQLYDVGRTQDPLGGTGWFEGAHLEPDVLLEDVIKVVYPDVAPNHKLTWLRNMQEEGHGNAHTCEEFPDRPGCQPTAEDLAARCEEHAAHILINDGCPLDIDGHAARPAVSLLAAVVLAATAVLLSA